MSRRYGFDEEFEPEFAEDLDDIDLDPPTSKRHKNRARRQVESLMERKRLRAMMGTDDQYWDDD
ncbi:MAG: hypothetical protein ACI9KN_002602 [Gammaproteobacteria bacterium]|jgi:hypothetical protein